MVELAATTRIGKGPKVRKQTLCLVAIDVFLPGARITMASGQQESGRVGLPPDVHETRDDGQRSGRQAPEDGKNAYSPVTGLPIGASADFGYRTAPCLKPDYDTTVLQADSRIEFWIPPGRETFSWGPYVRLAGSPLTRVFQLTCRRAIQIRRFFGRAKVEA